MAYTLGDLVTEVRTRIKDNTFSASLIKYYIQDTQDEVLGRNRLKFTELILTTVISDPSSQYVFASTVQTTSRFTYATLSNPAQVYYPTYVPYREFVDSYGSATVAGLPLYYTLYGNTLLLSCPLSEDITATIYYTVSSSTLSADSDVPLIPVEFKQLLVRGALAGVEEYRENYDQAAIHKRYVEDLTEDLVSRFAPRQFNKAPKATQSRRRYGKESAWV